MPIYLDIETIKELLGDKYYREQKQFTLEELKNFDGSGGKPAYVAVDGIVYDVSVQPAWGGGSHFGLISGKDLTQQFKGCHSSVQILSSLPKVGILKVERWKYR
ncbi:putative cytochrome b5-like Heme/Steroid binding domain protein [Clostridiales bacterium oral taxon 876 str. F0540]|nr:putative cytochrome b5-like Heme/Steroid binding domain protein [Clostridiales bacterium oral taxon 876 str. F0540]